ncbi:hypothetical protein KP509_23G068400 [Ceratopteris richardii]|uniref:Fungal lipase-type domain-containing protein n=1 Tax=Ceratopteris richardii TaxID=49495 RepID=A0A8T2S377_CERRI|nr:hypothetical protein KP509_23G068400 [Ceratopteris richardii]
MADVVDSQKLDLVKIANQPPVYRIARYERWRDLISAILSLFIPSTQVLWSPFISFYAIQPALSISVKRKAEQPAWQELVSRAVLIVLLAIKVPLAVTGAFIEWLLNFYYFNNGIVGLLFRFICFPRGIVLFPNSRDLAYRSVIGWMDQRTDLIYPYSMKLKVDPSAEKFYYDSKHFADLCIMASKIAYESTEVQEAIVNDQWKMNYGKFYECPNAHAFSPGFLQKLMYMVLGFVQQILIRLQQAIDFLFPKLIPIFGSILKVFLRSLLDQNIAAIKVLKEWTSLLPKTYAFTFMNKRHDADLIVLAFRGTEPFCADAWSTDFDFSYLEVGSDIGRLHWGFLQALGLIDKSDPNGSASRFIQNLIDAEKLYATGVLVAQEGHIVSKMTYEKNGVPYDHLAFDWIHMDLIQLLQENPKAKLVITGHSLGGALAALFAGLIFCKKMKGKNLVLERLAAIYTFGQPRVGDKVFARFMTSKMEEHNVQYFRVVFAYDIVPRVPFDDRIFGFKHFGFCCYNTILYQQKVVIKFEIASLCIEIGISCFFIVLLHSEP